MAGKFKLSAFFVFSGQKFPVKLFSSNKMRDMNIFQELNTSTGDRDYGHFGRRRFWQKMALAENYKVATFGVKFLAGNVHFGGNRW